MKVAKMAYVITSENSVMDLTKGCQEKSVSPATDQILRYYDKLTFVQNDQNDIYNDISKLSHELN